MAKAKNETAKARGWILFDRIVRDAAFRDTNPWENGGFVPDFECLEALLGVPLLLNANTQSGVPALALDVWIAYELRRAGLDADGVWPRESTPRVISPEILRFVDGQLKKTKDEIRERLAAGGKTYGGTVGASANLLGKNYLKQVDVVMSSWQTGPEVMISTKRMDSSFAKNAANRIEESYGDAKNLRLRHPQAAAGFVFALRSTCWDEDQATAHWLTDLLAKLGREQDAYHAVCLLAPQYGGEIVDDGEDSDGRMGDAAVGEADPELDLDLPEDEVSRQLADLPVVRLQHQRVPEEVSAQRFFKVIINTLLDNTPVDWHTEARRRRGDVYL